MNTLQSFMKTTATHVASPAGRGVMAQLEARHPRSSAAHASAGKRLILNGEPAHRLGADASQHHPATDKLAPLLRRPRPTPARQPSSLAALNPDNGAPVVSAPSNATLTPDDALHLEVAALMVQSLNLDMDAGSIDPTAPLYGDGLGLDSIDILELALVVSKQYGFQLRSEDSDNTRIFSSLQALTAHIAQHRTT
jgi:acyl carrier protein